MIKPHRIEEYNFRSTNRQSRFNVLTSETNMLSDCFTRHDNFSTQVASFKDVLKKIQGKSFMKMKTRKRKFAETGVGKMLEARKNLKLEVDTNPSNEAEAKFWKLNLK